MKRNREWISQGFVLTIIFLALTAAAQTLKAAPEEKALLEKWINVFDYE